MFFLLEGTKQNGCILQHPPSRAGAGLGGCCAGAGGAVQGLAVAASGTVLRAGPCPSVSQKLLACPVTVPLALTSVGLSGGEVGWAEGGSGQNLGPSWFGKGMEPEFQPGRRVLPRVTSLLVPLGRHPTAAVLRCSWWAHTSRSDLGSAGLKIALKLFRASPSPPPADRDF